MSNSFMSWAAAPRITSRAGDAVLMSADDYDSWHASHSLDFLLVFGTLNIDEVRNHPSALPDAADEVVGVSGHMRSDWVRFATTGNPGWAPYDPHTRSTRVCTADP